MVIPQRGTAVNLLQRQPTWTVDVRRRARGRAFFEQQGQRAGDVPQELDVAARLTGLGGATRDLAHPQAVTIVAVAGRAGRGVLGEPVGLVVRQGLGLTDAWDYVGAIATIVVLIAGCSRGWSRAGARSGCGPAELVRIVAGLLNRALGGQVVCGVVG